MFTAEAVGANCRRLCTAGAPRYDRLARAENPWRSRCTSASVPVFTRMLGHLAAWFDKAEAHAQAKKFDNSV